MCVTSIQKPTVFPGLPARLEVVEQYNFHDFQDWLFLKHIWRFYNKEGDSKSLINRVEVWLDREDKICLINIYFKNIGCEEMQKAFSHLKPITYHHHERSFCTLNFENPESMKAILNVLMDSHKFVGNSKERMGFIVSKL